MWNAEERCWKSCMGEYTAVGDFLPQLEKLKENPKTQWMNVQ